MKLKLVHKSTGAIVQIGETLTDFRGDLATFQGYHEPYDFADSPNRGAKVYVTTPDVTYQQQYYPSVYGLEFVLA
jgi:hypothetical protein